MYKRNPLLLLFTVITVLSNAQNIGIGNTSPDYKVDISGRIRIRGGINENFTAGLWLAGTGTDSVTNKTFMGMRTDSSFGFYSEPAGWIFTVDRRNGYIGIAGNNSNPHVPISMGNTGGDKISLFRDGNGNNYGLGIGNSTLQLLTPHSASHIVFGYGNSASFTESMRISGNGGVGIGTSSTSLAGITVNKKFGAVHALLGGNTTGVAIESDFPGIGLNSYYNGSRKTISSGFSGYIGLNPISGAMQILVSTQSNAADASATYNTALDIKPNGNIGIGISDAAYKLDVGDRMRIRATPGYTAGIWLNNEANTALASFVGLQADNQVGFFGFGSAGWGFLMNTQNGAISVGGSTGVAGQVLTSNGSGSAPSWQGGAGGGKPFVVRPSANSPDLGTSGRVDVPGMVANFTLTTPSQVVFQFKLSIANRSCFGCGDRRTFIVLVQNIIGGTTDIATTTVYTPNGEIADGVSGPIVVDLAPGTYSYKVLIAPSIYGAATVYARQQEGIMTWQIYPN
jgi:hypothetical protein